MFGSDEWLQMTIIVSSFFQNIAKITFIYIQGRLNGADGRQAFFHLSQGTSRWFGPCWPLTCQSEIYKRYPILSTSQSALPE